MTRCVYNSSRKIFDYAKNTYRDEIEIYRNKSIFITLVYNLFAY